MSIFALRSNGLASSAYKNLSRTQSSLNSNIGRLSSGLRINSTADDSAGSNVTVRMSNQVSGMAQANRNTQEANNLLAAAESGLSDISNILSKMRELSVQAATDTLNDNDRSSIDLEFQALKDELTRISNATEYNGMNVLNGTYQSDDGRGHWRLQIGADNDINNQHEFSIMNATAKGLDLNRTDHHQNWYSFNLDEFTEAISDGDGAGGSEQSLYDGGVYINEVDGVITFNPGDPASLTEVVWNATANTATGLLTGGSGALVAGTKVITDIGTNADPDGVGAMDKVWVVSDEVGGTASTFTSDIHTSMSNENRYWNGAYDEWSEDYDTNVGSVNAARSAVTSLDAAIDEINRERSYVGSEQNKLQFTMSNLTSTINSIETARSNIEDVDYALEMSELSKNQILVQSSTAMLAQANMVSQNVLQLLSN